MGRCSHHSPAMQRPPGLIQRPQLSTGRRFIGHLKTSRNWLQTEFLAWLYDISFHVSLLLLEVTKWNVLSQQQVHFNL